MSLKAEQKSRTRAAILESSAKLLRQRGIVGARVADVMAGAGLTVGGFYAHWPSKEALVDETIASTAEAMRARLFAGLEDKPAGDRAEVVVKRYLTAAHRDAPNEGCCFPAVASEIADASDALAPNGTVETCGAEGEPCETTDGGAGGTAPGLAETDRTACSRASQCLDEVEV